MATSTSVVQNISDFADDPTSQFNTLLSTKVSGIAYSRHTDTKLDDMFALQSKTVDPAARMKIVNDFERYALTQAYNIPLLCDRMTRREAAYDGLIRSMLAEDVLARGSSARITLPPAAHEWVDRTTSTWIEWVEQSGIDVVGDVEELRVRPPEPGDRWRDPDRVPARKRSKVALNALAAMTVEAAKRPDPEQTLRGRVRQGADRLKRW